MVKRYFDTHFGIIAVYTFVALVGGYMIAGDTSWRIMLCIAFAFFCGVRLGFGEAVTRFKERRQK